MRRRRETPRFEEACFLTIDLDVRSRRSLAPLMAAWPSQQSYQPISDPRWLILHALPSKTAEADAKKLLDRIGRLRGAARLAWKHAHRRTFDIGVRSGGAGRAFEEVRLTAETLGRIGAVGAQVQVTVYPAEPWSPPFVPPRRRIVRKWRVR